VGRAERRVRRRHGRPDAAAGFGGGAAGRAAALLRLAARTGCARHATAGRALLASVVDAIAPATPAHGTGGDGGWCDGAPGVGLALAAALDAGDAARDRWAHALDGIARRAADVLDAPARRASYTACCGTLARVELLTAAGEALAEPAHLAAARRLARAAVVRARRRLAYHPVAHLDPTAPSLLGGLAGVVHTLLRAAWPEALPSVLAGAPPGR